MPPKITFDSITYVEAGENITLSCNATGDPLPKISWTKDGIPHNQFNTSGSTLRLVNIQEKEIGSYRCTASNGYGQDASVVNKVIMKCRWNFLPKLGRQVFF